MNGYQRNIVWKKSTCTKKILQIYRKGMEYALVSKNYEQCNEFVLCKDFLQDIVYSAIYNKKINIYNFNYDPKSDCLPYLEKIRLLVTNSSDPKLSKKIENSLDIINQLENKLGIKPSILRECRNPPKEYSKCGIWLFEGNKRWINSPPMLSLYSLFIRIGCNHKKGTNYKTTIEDILSGKISPYQKKDVIWLKHAGMGIEKIEKLGDKNIFFRNIKHNYPNFPVTDIHNSLGITGFACDVEEKLRGNSVTVPGWHS